jgi:hypothetical protein
LNPARRGPIGRPRAKFGKLPKHLKDPHLVAPPRWPFKPLLNRDPVRFCTHKRYVKRRRIVGRECVADGERIADPTKLGGGFGHSVAHAGKLFGELRP